MTIKIITISMSAFILIFVVELIRREKLTFKYAFSWLFICSLAIFFAVFDKVLFSLARSFGFVLPSNFIFFGILSLIIFLILLMTLFLCQQNRHNDVIAQKIALMENEINEMKKKIFDGKGH